MPRRLARRVGLVVVWFEHRESAFELVSPLVRRLEEPKQWRQHRVETDSVMIDDGELHSFVVSDHW